MAPDLRLDVGQLLWVGFDGCEPPPALLAELAAGEVGGVILFARNLPRRAGGELDLDGMCGLVGRLRAAVPPELPPLLVSIDQEGGRVQRLRAPATEWPPMFALDALAPREAVGLAREVGRAIGRELATVGIDLDFAPVLDVHTNPTNPIIGDRAFGTTPEAVADRALAFADGLAAAGVVACGKHFPGHGDTSTDSHLELPRVEASLARLHAVELAPFARAARAGLPTIMTAHVVFAAVDAARPATLSAAVVRGVLREELGYRGVIVSDDLDMRAVADHFGAGEAARLAIEAGCDALLLCRDRGAQAEARAALTAGARRSAALAARVAEAAAAVRALKAPLGTRTAPDPERARAVLGCADHLAVRERMAVGGATHA
jgi:beta-N-acetylhexosaminidase